MKKIILLMLCFLSVFVSCKKETVQTYLLATEQKPEFVSFDVSSSLLNLSKLFVDKEDMNTLNSIKKVKLIGLSIEDAREGQYEEEKERLKNILTNSEYKKLMSFKKDNQEIKIFYNGNTNDIDEFIAFGYNDALGLGLARVMGSNMNPEAIAKIIEDEDLSSILNNTIFK